MIRTASTLRTIFGAGVVFDPVPCFREIGWLPAARASRDALSGGQLALAHDTPVICHADAASPRVLRLLEDAGHRPPERLLPYRTESDYEALLGRLASEGRRIVVQHAHADGVIDEDALWIPSALLRSLNDKGRLADLAPRETLARRRVIPAAAFAGLAPEALPIVVKVSSPASSGAAFGVRVCFTPDDWRRAQADLARSPAVVLEEWLDIETSWCVQFVVAPDGALRGIGSAEQVTGRDGSWRGNWIDGPAPPVVADLGAAVVDAAAARGYRGVAGVDVARVRDGRLVVLDGNFRFNGSTVPLLLRDALAEMGKPVLRSAGWSFRGPFEEMDRAIRDALERRWLLPYAVWDPREGAPGMSAVVAGVARGEIDARMEELKLAGFRTQWDNAGG